MNYLLAAIAWAAFGVLVTPQLFKGMPDAFNAEELRGGLLLFAILGPVPALYFAFGVGLFIALGGVAALALAVGKVIDALRHR